MGPCGYYKIQCKQSGLYWEVKQMHDGSFQLLQSEFNKSAPYAQLFDIHQTGEGQYGYTYCIYTSVAMRSMILNFSDNNCITFVHDCGLQNNATTELTVPYDHRASTLFY